VGADEVLARLEHLAVDEQLNAGLASDRPRVSNRHCGCDLVTVGCRVACGRYELDPVDVELGSWQEHDDEDENSQRDDHEERRERLGQAGSANGGVEPFGRD